MAGSLSDAELVASLDDLRTGLVADGYELSATTVADKIEIRIIVARPDVCEGCLVPKQVMVQIALSLLHQRDASIAQDDLVFVYPDEVGR